jgi:hypothetical protein
VVTSPRHSAQYLLQVILQVQNDIFLYNFSWITFITYRHLSWREYPNLYILYRVVWISDKKCF